MAASTTNSPRTGSTVAPEILMAEKRPNGALRVVGVGGQTCKEGAEFPEFKSIQRGRLHVNGENMKVLSPESWDGRFLT